MRAYAKGRPFATHHAVRHDEKATSWQRLKLSSTFFANFQYFIAKKVLDPTLGKFFFSYGSPILATYLCQVFYFFILIILDARCNYENNGNPIFSACRASRNRKFPTLGLNKPTVGSVLCRRSKRNGAIE